MGRPSREKQISHAALRCFARLGYDGTRVRHIATEAGVSEAALYRHWKSKQDLAAAVFADGMRRYADDLAVAAASDGTVQERLAAVIGRMLDLYRDEPHLTVFLIEQQARFLAALPAQFPYPLHVVERLVAAGQSEGAVKRGDARLLGAMALGCVTRPILVSRYAERWSFDPGDRAARALIAEGAWQAIRRPD